MVNMFFYTFSKTASNKAFENACTAIETKAKGIKNTKMLVDVDGSQMKIYNTTDGKIKVCNDYEVDAVYAESEMNLTDIL